MAFSGDWIEGAGASTLIIIPSKMWYVLTNYMCFKRNTFLKKYQDLCSWPEFSDDILGTEP